jgi:hypothetical protein
MFSTSSLYFLVAVFGESIESDEIYDSRPAEGQEEVVDEFGPVENRKSLGVLNETRQISEQHLQEVEAPSLNTSDLNPIEPRESNEMQHKEMFEKQHRILEFPLSVGAGIGYAAIGLWMILDKRNTKSPYIIAIVGSLILLGIYTSSRTIGISNLGIESVGLFDAVVAGLQISIVATCLYVVTTKIYSDGTPVNK